MNGDQPGFGAVSSTSSKSRFVALTSSRASPLSSVTATSAANATTINTAMAAPTFLPPSQPFKPTGIPIQSPYTPLSMNNVNPFERDPNTKPIGPVGTPYVTSPASMSQVLIRRLPLDTTEEKLRLMVVFSQDLVDVEILPVEQSEDPGFRSATLRFKTLAGAQQTKDMLNGKSITNDVEMIVEVLSGSPIGSRRYPIDHPVSAASSAASSTTSSGPTSRQPSRFSGAFQTLEKISPTANGIYGANELPNPESRAHYQNLFSPQSPIGNHLSERTGISGKILISRDEDDETGELLKDPVAFAETNQHRRATAPQLPISRLAALSLNTTSPGPASVPQYGIPTMTPISAQGSAMSPTVMNNGSSQWNYPMSNQHYQRHNFPPVNPADQNPPCNTLYVGNLPIDTSEEELKAMFSKQRGYKRLCFRTKQNGPMCFVEFEDVSFATKALHELYGHPLHNSVKGGIRLSFSKNPLGVRSGQAPGQPGTTSMAGMNNMMGAAAGSFTTANGPPPGLAAPPGLNRMGYNGGPAISSGTSTPYSSASYSNGSSNVWNNSYNGPLSANGVSSSSSNYPPPYMMGR